MTSQEEHYEQLPGLSRSWKVSAVQFELSAKRVVVEIYHDGTQPLVWPECGKSCAYYDDREMREWRQSDTIQFETILP